MKKSIFVFLVIMFTSLNYNFAQSQKIIVDTKGAASLNVNSAFLTKLPANKELKTKEAFQLNFSVPNQFETLLPQTSVTLTGYKKDGSVFGMSTWCSMSNVQVNKIIDNILQIKLDVDSKLQGANTFSLSMAQRKPSTVENIAESCDECANLAIRICGTGQVASVTCPTNPKIGPAMPCSFTCQP